MSGASEKKLLWVKFKKITKLLSFIKQSDKLREFLKIDFSKNNLFNDLPEKTKDHNLFFLHESFWKDSNDLASNTFCGINGKVEIFNLKEDIHIVFNIDDSFINSSRNGFIDKFAENNTIFQHGEEFIGVWVDREVFFANFIFNEDSVNDFDKCSSFFFRERLVREFTASNS